MTRRRVLFVDHDGKQLVITDEYNGDKSEFLAMGSQDSCDKDWDEMEREFLNCYTLSQFEEADRRCQGYYHSCICQMEYQPLTFLDKSSDTPDGNVLILWCGSMYPSHSISLRNTIQCVRDEGADDDYLLLLEEYLEGN